MQPTPPILEITDLLLAPFGREATCGADRLAIAPGDVIAIDANTALDSRQLLRVLATLERPEQGRFRFDGSDVDLDDYRRCLAVKRRIGYVAPDCAMISNRTIRENLLLGRFYHENDLSIDLDQTMTLLCNDAGLSDDLERRPSELNDSALMRTIAIREMGKRPRLMLIDRPENFIRVAPDDVIFNHLKHMVQLKTAVVFFSTNKAMSDLGRRQLTLHNGTIRIGNRKGAVIL
jgi:putative ABC transport system ATP-binding protein